MRAAIIMADPVLENTLLCRKNESRIFSQTLSAFNYFLTA